MQARRPAVTYECGRRMVVYATREERERERESLQTAVKLAVDSLRHHLDSRIAARSIRPRKLLQCVQVLVVVQFHDLPQKLLRDEDVDEDVVRPERRAFKGGGHDCGAAGRKGYAVVECEGVGVHHPILDADGEGHRHTTTAFAAAAVPRLRQ